MLLKKKVLTLLNWRKLWMLAQLTCRHGKKRNGRCKKHDEKKGKGLLKDGFPAFLSLTALLPVTMDTLSNETSNTDFLHQHFLRERKNNVESNQALPALWNPCHPLDASSLAPLSLILAAWSLDSQTNLYMIPLRRWFAFLWNFVDLHVWTKRPHSQFHFRHASWAVLAGTPKQQKLEKNVFAPYGLAHFCRVEFTFCQKNKEMHN